MFGRMGVLAFWENKIFTDASHEFLNGDAFIRVFRNNRSRFWPEIVRRKSKDRTFVPWRYLIRWKEIVC